MMSPASSAADDEETQIDYEKEMAMASVRGGRGKALPWTSMDTILDYEEVGVVPKHYSQLQKQYLQIERLRNLNRAEFGKGIYLSQQNAGHQISSENAVCCS
jgi:hypothetical protein